MKQVSTKLYKLRHACLEGDIFDSVCPLLDRDVLDNVFVRDSRRIKEIPFIYNGVRYKRQYEWVFRGDVAKILIGEKRKRGIEGAMVYINYSRLRYEPYVAIVDPSDVFESIDMVAEMVARALSWVYKDHGIVLYLEPWISEDGKHAQWGRDCNEAHTLAAAKGTLQVDEEWDLKTCVNKIIKKHTKKLEVSPPKKGKNTTPKKTIRAAVIDQTKADKVLLKINNCIMGKTEPKDEMMPITAACAANVMRLPTWTELKNSYPWFRLSETSFYRLRQPDCLSYMENDSFDELVDYFKNV